ncbi:hypothetical protein D9M68_548600 [compost metagenome]
MSISLAQSCRPMCSMTPPGCTAASAAGRVSLPPTASTTSSYAPGAGAVSRGSNAVQPACRPAEARRNGLVSAKLTRHPWLRSNSAVSRPMAPPPTTSARASANGRKSARCASATPCKAVAAGSVSAAAAAGMSCGTGIRQRSGMAMNSANAPGRVMPTMPRSLHRLLRPCTQKSHRPQWISGFPVTRWPARLPPTSVPTNSWPRISGGLRRGSCP